MERPLGAIRALLLWAALPIASLAQSEPIDQFTAQQEAVALRFDAALVSDWSTILRGLLDVGMEADGEALFGLSGLRLEARFQVQRGRDGSLDTGDIQVYSNIDGPDRVQLSHLLIHQQLVEDQLWLKIGKYDANDDFARVDAGVYHVHSSFGFAPSVVGFPSYPDQAFGLALLSEYESGFYARGAIFDGATQAGVATGPRGPGTVFGSPSAWFLIGEFGLRYDEPSVGGGRLASGTWRHTGPFERADGSNFDGLGGVYANWEQHLPHVGTTSADDDGLRVFAQYGYSDPKGSLIEHYAGLGLTWTGIGAQRPEDVLGFGLAWAGFRDQRLDGLRGGGELAVEAFWRLQMTPSVAVVPDLQWLHDPSGDNRVEDALVLTLRLDATL